MKRKQYTTVFAGLMFFATLDANAISPKGSCVDYAYEKAREFYTSGKWVAAYAYLVSTQICVKHSRFEDPGEAKIWYEELKAARGEAWNQIHKKEGFSLTKPRLRPHPPR